jgi:acid stress chaperone HdeB
VTKIKSIAVGLLLCLVAVPFAGAQVMIDASKITCRDFTVSTLFEPDHIAFWLDGYYNGKRDNTVLDVNGLQDYLTKVREYCLRNQDTMVMKAAEMLLGAGK